MFLGQLGHLFLRLGWLIENSRSRSWPRSNLMVLFEAWSSIDIFVFRFVAIGPLLAEIERIPYSILKIQGQGHSQGQPKVKTDGPIWGLKLNRYVCFSFRGNRTILGRGRANSILTLKIQGQGNGPGQSRWSQLRPRVQSMCLPFVSWQSDHFWLRYSKFHVWSWKLKVEIDQNLIRHSVGEIRQSCQKWKK